MFDYIKTDLHRFFNEDGGLRGMVRGILSQGFQALLVYRFFRWFHVHGIPTQPIRFLIERIIEIITGISIPAEAEIGKGLRIHHFGGIFFHPRVKMGEYCTIYQGVTLGDKGGYGGAPSIGNNVLIGVGSKVLGPITIGDNAVISANSLVIRPVPDNAIVLGVPAKVIGDRRMGFLGKHSQPEKPQKINVLQCRSTYTTGGGPDKTVLLIGELANPEKFNIVLMYMRNKDDENFQVANWAREKGLTIHEVLERGKFDVDNLRQIHRLIQEYRIDILHARDYKTCFFGYLLSKINRRMKLIFTAHGWIVDSTKMKFYTWLNLYSLKRYHKIIAVSKATKQIMLDSGIKGDKIAVLHNAIDVEMWKRENVTSTVRQELHIPETSKIVGIIGRLRYEKDIPTTLKVAQKVIQERSDTYFLVVGDGPDRVEAEHQVQQMGLTENILFLGFRKDAMNIYAALDIFASTSLTEGTPNTVLEALAMEVPVVHTAVGGVPELIEDGVDGILCKVGDVHGIAQVILSILNNDEKAEHLRQQGRRSVCTKFSLTQRLKTLETLYEEVMIGNKGKQ